MGAYCSNDNVKPVSKKPDFTPVGSSTNIDKNENQKGVVNKEGTIGINIKQKKHSNPDVHDSLQRLTNNPSPLNETFDYSRTTDQTSIAKVYHYKKGPLIGKGTYGEVYECLNLNTGELLAVKSFKIQGDLGKILGEMEALKKEMFMIKNLEHENIVKYYTSDMTEVIDGNHVIVDVIQEYVSGGSVRKLLDKFNKLEEKVIGTYIYQVISGLAYLHKCGIIHRNIKASNILIDTSGVIKLTEYGCSGRTFTESSSKDLNRSTSIRGQPYWAAPEVILRKSQTSASDIWSIGCVIIEMLTGLHPWSGQIKSTEDFIQKLHMGTPPLHPKDISQNCKEFLQLTFKPKPEERPTLDELLEHPFIKENYNLNDSSYMEAESVAGTSVSYLHSQRTGLSDFRHHMDRTSSILKGNTLVGGKTINDNISISNISLGRLQTLEVTHQNTLNKDIATFKANHIQDFARQTSEDKQLLAMAKAQIMENKVKNEVLGPRGNLRKVSDMNERHGTKMISFVNQNSLRNVQEESNEEEASPARIFHRHTHQFGTAHSNFKTIVQTDDEVKLKRQQLEEQMNRDLMRVNSGQVNDVELKRRQLEEQMARDLQRINSGQVNDIELKRKQLEEQMARDLQRINSSQVNDVELKRKQLEEQMATDLQRINSSNINDLELKRKQLEEQMNMDLMRVNSGMMSTNEDTIRVESISPDKVAPAQNNLFEGVHEKSPLQTRNTIAGHPQEYEGFDGRRSEGSALRRGSKEGMTSSEGDRKGRNGHIRKASTQRVATLEAQETSISNYNTTSKFDESLLIQENGIWNGKLDEDMLGSFKGVFTSEMESADYRGSPPVMGDSPDNNNVKRFDSVRSDFPPAEMERHDTFKLGVIHEDEELKESLLQSNVYETRNDVNQ